MNKIRTAILVGSLRKGSYSRMVAQALMALAPSSVELEILEIAQLSMYNQDLDESSPKPWMEFRKKLHDFDSILFVTPEYNRSVPGVLNNAIDIASRPYGENSLSGKPGAVVSVSVGAMGGFGANHQLRQSLVFLNVPAMAQPEAYIGEAAKLFDKDGKLTNESTRLFLTKFMLSFVQWVEKNKI